MMNYEVNFVLINEQDEEKKNTNSTLCKICKGACCCQNCGCVYSPEDFYVLTHEFSRRKRIRYLIAFLKRGTASIEHKKMKNQLTGAVDIESVRNMGELADLKYLKISRDKLLNSEGVLYLRARNEGQGVLDYIHPNYEKDTGCALLTSEGCPYSYSKRPKGEGFLYRE